jgi:hypothetical protein
MFPKSTNSLLVLTYWNSCTYEFLMNVVTNKNFNPSKPKYNWLHKKQNYATQKLTIC